MLALALLCICLFAIVRTLNSLLQGNIRKGIKKFINAEFPGKCKYFTGYIAIVIGMGLTILVQSSSIFTSAMTPLVGVGVVSIERMYPLTLGANIGTTTTGIMAAMANDNTKDLQNALQIAFCHLFFNISGIILFYPIPFMRWPIPMAKFLGNETAKYRWYAIAYLIVVFFLTSTFGVRSVCRWLVRAGSSWLPYCPFHFNHRHHKIHSVQKAEHPSDEITELEVSTQSRFGLWPRTTKSSPSARPNVARAVGMGRRTVLRIPWKQKSMDSSMTLSQKSQRSIRDYKADVLTVL